MLETFKTYIIGEWKVIRHAPATILMAVGFITMVLWAAFNWSYGAIVSSQSAEMRLLERQLKDYERQVDALQKKSATMSSDLANSADLVLEIFDNERTPSRISYDNIWRWYYLRTIIIGIEKDTGKEHKNTLVTLFVTFEKPVKVGTLEVSAHGFVLPRHEVKEFTNRYAIIVFSDEIPAGTLRIQVHG